VTRAIERTEKGDPLPAIFQRKPEFTIGFVTLDHKGLQFPLFGSVL
jgi:hypothetical protein